MKTVNVVIRANVSTCMEMEVPDDFDPADINQLEELAYRDGVYGCLMDNVEQDLKSCRVVSSIECNGETIYEE